MVITVVRVLIRVVKIVDMVISLLNIIIRIVSKVIRSWHEGLIGLLGCQQCQDGQLKGQDGCEYSQYCLQNDQDGHPNYQAGCSDNHGYHKDC